MLAETILSILSRKPLSTMPKIFADHITAYCQKCQKNRIDVIFDYYSNPNIKLCKDCLIHAKIFVLLVNSLFSNLGLEKNHHDFFFDKYKKVSESIIRGIACFGIRKPFVTGSPIAVVWNYTDKCNLRCSHCYADANSLKEKELTTKERFKIIDRLAEAGVVALNFSGGEPLIREDLFEVAEYAHENGLSLSISTNGTLIDRDRVKRLVQCGIESIDISLDGIKPETHDRIRNVEGSFDLAVSGLKNCAMYGNFNEIIVNTTLTKFTLKEIPEIYEFVKDLGATRYYVSRILPAGRGKNFLEFDVGQDDKIEILNFLYNKFYSSVNGGDDIICLTRGMTYFSRLCYENSAGTLFPACEILTGYEKEHEKYFKGKLSSMIVQMRGYFSGCATGLNYCGLDPTGAVLPCAPASMIRLGNILETPLEEIWISHPLFKKVRQRERIKGRCSICYSKEYCGGCRLTSFGEMGDWLSHDVSCPF